MGSVWAGSLRGDDRAALERRHRRIDAGMRRSTSSSIKRLREQHSTGRRPDRIRYRNGYACLDEPGDPAASDRRALDREKRPPVTRLISPRGAALRLHLTALAIAQFTTRPGQRFTNPFSLVPAATGDTGWTDLLAATATDRTRGGRTNLTARDKRRRQAVKSLQTLSSARLVRLPRMDRGSGKYEGFELLDETASRGPDDDPFPYTVPKTTDDTFGVPAAFALNGWLHLLEDTELAVLLMVACGRHSIESEWTVVPATKRNQYYGITREMFEAHHALAAFGLVEVESRGRHGDGKSTDFEDQGPLLHRLRLIEGGFEVEAIERISQAIADRLGS